MAQTSTTLSGEVSHKVDITGTDILQETDQPGRRAFEFVKGPIFANIVLADEINRTPPKTQSALLEAMQEHRVTASGKVFELPRPFFVLATQNPIEQEGTYSLPEAQLDRFMFFIHVDYPTAEEELRIAKETTGGGIAKLKHIITGEQVLKFQEVVPKFIAFKALYFLALLMGFQSYLMFKMIPKKSSLNFLIAE